MSNSAGLTESKLDMGEEFVGTPPPESNLKKTQSALDTDRNCIRASVHCDFWVIFKPNFEGSGAKPRRSEGVSKFLAKLGGCIQTLSETFDSFFTVLQPSGAPVRSYW
jgi:hypothetical protein